jgi:hypothetical protein
MQLMKNLRQVLQKHIKFQFNLISQIFSDKNLNMEPRENPKRG